MDHRDQYESEHGLLDSSHQEASQNGTKRPRQYINLSPKEEREECRTIHLHL